MADTNDQNTYPGIGWGYKPEESTKQMDQDLHANLVLQKLT